jgi:hypothetical protein
MDVQPDGRRWREEILSSSFRPLAKQSLGRQSLGRQSLARWGWRVSLQRLPFESANAGWKW